MRIFSKLTGSVAAAALLAAAAAPASAKGWHGDWHRHDRGPSAGAVIGAIAAVGIFAAIASAASKKAAERDYEAAPPPPYDDRDDGWDRDGDDGARYDSRSNPPRYDDSRGNWSAQDSAVDACVVAARDEASRGGDYAEIQGVNGVSASGRGWDVTGQVEQRSSYRANDGWSRNFRCSFADGRVTGVTLD